MTDGPLAGCRVLVTRPATQAGALCHAIEAAGGEAIRFPVIRISPQAPQAVAGALGRLPDADIVIFVSRNAADLGLPFVQDGGAAIAAVGPATAAAIEARGVRVDIIPDGGFDSEHLLGHPALRSVEEKSILIVRGESGRELLREELEARGALVNYLPVYRRELNKLSPECIAAVDRDWQAGRIDCVTVMSVGTFENLVAQLPPTSLEQLRQTPLVAPGERVIQTACDQMPGIRAILAPGPRADDMVNALQAWWHCGQKS